MTRTALAALLLAAGGAPALHAQSQDTGAEAATLPAGAPASIENVSARVENAEGFRPLLWSPDGKSIALFKPRDHIHILDVATGSTWHVITADEGTRLRVAWSEDGRSLYYLLIGEENHAIKQFDIETGETGTIRILDDFLILSVWRGLESPEHRRIVSEEGGAVLLSSDEGDAPLVEWEGECADAELSPSGDRVLFRFDGEGAADDSAGRADGLYTMPLLTRQPKRIAGSADASTWHPGGEWIVCSSSGENGDGGNAGEEAGGPAGHRADLFAISTVTGEIRRLTDTETRFETFPRVSPDGLRIAFCNSEAKTIYIGDVVYE
jgi:Tol biopolymer transport system component